MTKKKKIILSSVIVGVVLLGIILTVILVNIKRFDMRATSQFDYNRHSTMLVIDRDSTYTYTNRYYAGGTEIVKKTSTGQMGLYSYIQNKNVVAPEYDDVSIVSNNTETHKSYFRLTKNSLDKMIKIVDESGKDLSFLKYDSTKNVTTSEIKTRTIDVQETKNSVKTKINKKYHNEKIEILDAKPITTSEYKTYYYMEDLYYYEVWELRTTDNLTYINLYKVDSTGHALIQTLNNELGVSLESLNLELNFLTDGTPILINKREIKYGSEVQAIEYEMYDINFNLKGKSQINSSVNNYVITEARIGNYRIYQTVTEANEDKYDFFVTTTTSTKYFNLNTFKLNMKNADISEVKFDYLISDVNDTFNLKTALISAQKIKNKKLTTQENLLINDKLQSKKLSYDFDTIVKINNNRYVTSNGGTSNFNLIDKNYNIITHLENFNDVFATSNAIIVKDNEQTYICNYDGVVIKKIANSNFAYLNDDKYYLVDKTRTTDAGNFVDYYLEELGFTHENPLYTKTPSGYTFNGENVDNVIILKEDYATLILVVKSTGTHYTYSVYNTDGTLLGNIDGISTYNSSITNLYFDDNNVVLKIDTKYITLNR